MSTVFVFAVLLLFICSVHGLCPNGWTQYQNSCYYLFEDKEEWSQAMFLCQTHKAHLAITETPEENTFLENFVKNNQVHKNNVWIGADDMMTEGVFRWIETDQKLTFTDWSHGQPDNAGGDENCLEIHSNDYKWNDRPCNTRSHYICETSPNAEIVG